VDTGQKPDGTGRISLIENQALFAQMLAEPALKDGF
jgi:hypothetical protein